MSQWVSLWFVGLLIYLQDCLVLRTADSAVILRDSLGRWSRSDRRLLRFGRRILTLGGIFPWERQYLTVNEIISVSPKGFTATPLLPCNSCPPVVLFEKVKTIQSSGRSLTVDGVLFCECEDGKEATLLAAMLNDLRVADVKKRDENITAHIRKRWDIRSAIQRDEMMVSATARLRIIGVMLWSLIFIALILSVEMRMPIPFLVGTCLAVGIFLVSAAVRYFSTATLLRVGLMEVDRFTPIVQMLLCPVVAPRAALWLELHGLRDYDPKAALCAVAPKKPSPMTDEELRSIITPIVHPQKCEISQWFDGRVREVALASLEDACPALLNSAKKPPLKSSESIAYCPRCHSQYVSEREHCADCAGVKLFMFT
jgi:hypothetical protein